MMLMCSFQLWVNLGHRKEAVQLHKGANLQGQVGCLLKNLQIIKIANLVQKKVIIIKKSSCANVENANGGLTDITMVFVDV